MQNLTDLLRPKSEALWLDRLMASAMGDPDLAALPVTDWEDGGVARTFLQLFARSLAEMDAVRVTVAESGFLMLAHGGWLDELAESQYQVTRKPSAFAEGRLTLSSPALGPYLIAPGQLWVSTAGGQRYNNLDGGELLPGDTLALTFRAESPGSLYNVPNGTATIMNTPLPGVSVSNLSGWLLTAGADKETDESLAARSAARWAERGGGAVRAAYEYWALTSTPSVTKVLVLDEHPRGQGTANVIVWGGGGIGTAAVALANAYIQARRPVTADILVRAATERVVNVALTLTGTMTDRLAAMAQVLAGLQRLQIATPIGGTLYRAALIEMAMLPPGMVNAVLTSPATDVVLAQDEALTISPNVIWSGG